MGKKQTLSLGCVFRASKDVRLLGGALSLFLQIYSLSRKEGYCWANNHYFANLYKVDVSTISRWIGVLRTSGYLRVEIDQAHGNKRKMFPIPTPLLHEETTGKNEMTPSGTCADTSMQESEEVIHTDAMISMDKEGKGLLNSEKHNKDRMNKEKITKISLPKEDDVGNVVVVGENDTKSNPEENDSETATAKLLTSGRKLSQMNEEEKAEIVVAFAEKFEEVPDPDLAKKQIKRFLVQKGNAEHLFHAIWNLQFSKFGKAMASKLSYLLGGNSEVRISNAVAIVEKDLGRGDVKDFHMEAAKPFSDLLSHKLKGIDWKEIEAAYEPLRLERAD